ncbi:hypothetical protein DXG01_002353 [Tephrocybe rancida]|nr:hypothetical protein DXG01_002353 [Tephrocybe rancida]
MSMSPVVDTLKRKRPAEEPTPPPPPPPPPPLQAPSTGARVPVPLEELLRRANKAPRVPQDFIDKAIGQHPKRKSRLAARFEELAAQHPGGRDAYIAQTGRELTEWADKFETGRASRRPKTGREHVVEAYIAMMSERHPDLSSDGIWDADVVLEWAPVFLKSFSSFKICGHIPELSHGPQVNNEAKALPRRKTLKKRTLTCWASLFVNGILKHRKDPLTGEAYGTMARGGLFQTLRNQTALQDSLAAFELEYESRT